MDGQPLGRNKSTIGCQGSLLWFYVPQRGRFIFSLVPREGYSFQKIGILDNNVIEFIIDGEHYEWVSTLPILPNGGTLESSGCCTIETTHRYSVPRNQSRRRKAPWRNLGRWWAGLPATLPSRLEHQQESKSRFLNLIRRFRLSIHRA